MKLAPGVACRWGITPSYPCLRNVFFLKGRYDAESIIAKSTILPLNASRWSYKWRRFLNSRLCAKSSDTQGNAKWSGAVLS
jgi:hypothetical protein